ERARLKGHGVRGALGSGAERDDRCRRHACLLSLLLLGLISSSLIPEGVGEGFADPLRSLRKACCEGVERGGSPPGAGRSVSGTRRWLRGRRRWRAFGAGRADPQPEQSA